MREKLEQSDDHFADIVEDTFIRRIQSTRHMSKSLISHTTTETQAGQGDTAHAPTWRPVLAA